MNLTDTQKQFVEDLLNKMTLEEKVGQLNQDSPSIVGGFDVPFEELIEMLTDGRISQEEFGKIMATAERDFHEDDIRAGMVGAVMGNDPVKANELQKIAVEETRLGIPLLMGFDVIHGLRSVFPIAIAEAGSFDDDLMERTAQMAAKESRAYGINWNFAPMLDVARDSRWGRVSEGPGEDPFLASRFARAKIKGLQNNNEATDSYVAACTKHYVAYSACEAGRDYNTTTMSTSQLYNVYLPTFKAAMEEGACSAMASFNDLNGVPCTVNSYTLRDILKGELGLKGFVVSDANGIRECVTHGIAEDDVDAGIQALNAGLDMDMGTRIFYNHIADAVKAGKVSMETLDDAVRRILSVKVWLGLFENPYVPQDVIDAYSKALPAEHVALCEEAAEKSIVLLKNDDKLLPLDKSAKVTVVGELADRADEVVGAWSLAWEKDDCVSIKSGLEAAGVSFEYYPVCGPEGDLNADELKAAIESDSDIVIAVVGEYTSMSGEASSKADITLPGHQQEMLKKLVAAGKKVVAVLMNGRPLALGWEAEKLPAIIEGWHLGIQMGNAITKVLFGDVNPSGKLSSTFSSVNGQEPLYYNHPNTGRPGSKSKFTSKYLDAPIEPCFPFGYGLSYTTFEYSDLKLTETADEVVASFTLKNKGDVAGTEIAQLYMQDVTASLVRPVRELKAYERVQLNPGEEKQLTLSLRKCDMGFYNNAGKYLCEDGLYRIYVGGNSRDTLEAEIRIQFK
ncbi:beta-glucosidase [Pseudobutyrivibrio sp. ACV-2]|uniref:glycoside hydrolase family 3 N-terminal domain-containing protein n=1 Tax=Pseudobutyrivibrio sp. ACV-2 TaxID=1520801 RepID=UPI000894E51D|nr:glycoside hydrolase family 3 N-terminal domain-containing protein [Pseudobutyrivibrio sp. ACV-2]SEA37404.1 beta-glucosidase [Pseudobutyrivibrio sp. ACV-2]